MNAAQQRQLIAALAPAVQHDSNNMLTVMLATLELLRGGGDAALLARRLDRVETATRRLDALQRAFLALARQVPGEVQRADVAALLHLLQPLLHLAMARPASLTLDAPPSGVPIEGDMAALAAAVVERLRGVASATISLGPDAVLLRLDDAEVRIPI